MVERCKLVSLNGAVSYSMIIPPKNLSQSEKTYLVTALLYKATSAPDHDMVKAAQDPR